MKVEFTFPPELLNQIVEELFQRVKPLLMAEKHGEIKKDVIFDVSRLSEYLCVSPKWIYEQTHLKTIPHFKLGNKQLRFRKKDIDRWLDSLKTPSSASISSCMQGFSPPNKRVL